MIIQRLTAAIRRQDWFQVTIEVLIVIVGIFLGLQVQATYEEQQDRKMEKIYLLRLLDDADISIAGQERNIIRGEEKIGEIEKAYQLMVNQQVSEGNREEFSSHFNNIRGVYSMDVYLTTIDELVASGQVTLIQSQEIKEAIGLLRREYELLDRSQHDIALETLRLGSEMYELIDLDGAGETILNPLEDFDSDGVILRKFRTMRNHHNRFHSWNISIRDLTKEYKTTVLDELEKFQ